MRGPSGHLGRARGPAGPARAAASLTAAGPMDPTWWLGSLGLADIFAVLLAETAMPYGLEMRRPPHLAGSSCDREVL
jgi:hypothetical protein